MTDETTGLEPGWARRARASQFVGLVFAVAAIAARVKLPDAGPTPAWALTTDWDIVCRNSEAAALLHQALLNSEALNPGAPVRWARQHSDTFRPVVDSGAAAVGLRALVYAASWRERLEFDRFHARLTGKETPAADEGEPPTLFDGFGRHFLFPASALSIYREDLLRLLEASGVDHDLGVPRGVSGASDKAEPEGIEGLPQALVPNRRTVNRKGLISAVLRQWPTVERDLKDAATNGLSAEARGPRHNTWFLDAAVAWARARGKWVETTPSLASLPSWPPPKRRRS